MPKNHGNMWQRVRLKFLLSEPLQYGANEEGVEYSEDLPRYIRITDFDEEGRLREDTIKSLEIEKANGYYLEKGDVLFARSGATVGKTFQFKNTEEPACFAGYLIKARTERVKLHSDFLYYYTKSNEYTNWKNEIFSQATIQNIGANKYANLLVPTPSVYIQGKVISFLHQKCAMIDALIEKKQKLVELKKEERTALINQAVTKGLDPNVPMKDSGIEWLGEIPEHWEIKIIKYVSRIYNGATPKSSVEKYWNGTIIWITPDDLGNLRNKYLENSRRNITIEGYESCGTNIVPAGSIVISCRAPIGHIAILEKDACTNQGCKSIVPINVESIFLYYFLQSFRSVLDSLGQGSTFKELSNQKLSDFQILFPTIKEQKGICEFVNSHDYIFNKTIELIEKQIELLKEYKTTLISEAVTGKIIPA